MMTKLTISTLSIVAILATPAMAQKSQKRALVPSMSATMVFDGRYIGNDPDPRIRSDLHRDADTALGLN